MRLIENWNELPKMHSAQIAALAGAILYVWNSQPFAVYRDALPEWSGMALSFVIFILWVLARVINQEEVHHE